jgi:hypothetical protein
MAAGNIAIDTPGCIVSATTASFRSLEKRRRRATPVITSTFENVSDIGVFLGLSLSRPVNAGVRSKRGAVHGACIAEHVTTYVGQAHCIIQLAIATVIAAPRD